MRTTAYKKIIDADHIPVRLGLGDVWNYRYLVYVFTKKRLTLRYKQTILGPLWQVITPLLTSLIHMLVFGVVAKIGTDGIPMILFYLAGNSIWGFTSTVISQTANTFRSNANLFGKIYFPRLCVPLADVLTAAVDFLIRLFLLFFFCLYYIARGEAAIPFASWIFLPLILLWLGFMSMGLGIIISSLTTKYRDLSVLVTFGVQLWMYITPVVYPRSTLTGSAFYTLICWNPATAPVELFRHFLFGTGGIELRYTVFSLCFTVLVLILGILMFNRVERNFMDTI